MRHVGVDVGAFFLVGKEDGEEFATVDEEVLVLFASQAATAIANARTHREDQRARADLETLVETSPVGVAVFDAGTGKLLSLNREAKRILESLRMPGSPPEPLLEVITCRRADGREITLDQFPLAPESNGAEEIVLSVPGGRSVTTLAQATPIRFADGTVESVVLTVPGPGTASGGGAAARGVPGHSEPRAACAAGFHQGLGSYCAGRLAGSGPGRGAPVLPHHR